MNNAELIPPQDAIDVRQLARAIRFALVAIVLGLSCFSIRTSLSIEGYEIFFHDMLGARPLPLLTQFVLGARPLFISLSVIIPITSFGTLFFRRIVASFYIIGVLGLVTIAQIFTLFHGLSAPLTYIISGINGSP